MTAADYFLYSGIVVCVIAWGAVLIDRILNNRRR
jgi:hypothetical protein